MRPIPALVLLTLLPVLAGVECVARTGPTPTPISRIDEPADVEDRAGFEALVAATEQARGLAFIRRPALELLAEDDKTVC